MDMLYNHFRLNQSALGRKVEAKPVGRSHRERSQELATMRVHEVAGLPGGKELHLGWNDERASSAVAKFVLSALFTTGRDAVQAVSGAPTYPVVQAITFRTGNVRFTDEVPRRPAHRGRVSFGYKSYTKGQGHASETGRASPQPRPKGCQQRQSRGSRLRLHADVCSERQNLRVPFGTLGFMGPVSPTFIATKWRDGTSSCQWVGSLSNSPTRPKPGPTAVGSR